MGLPQLVGQPTTTTEVALPEQIDRRDIPLQETTQNGGIVRQARDWVEFWQLKDQGIEVLASAEKLLNQHKFGGQVLDSEYDEYAQPFLDWVIEKDHEIIGTEIAIADGTIKTCGTIDVVLRDKESDEIFICDYKCRKSKQFYDKDLWQMAIECEMLRRRGLDYLPKCVSICIDINKKIHHHKVWSEDDQNKAIKIVKHISKLYWLLNM